MLGARAALTSNPALFPPRDHPGSCSSAPATGSHPLGFSRVVHHFPALRQPWVKKPKEETPGPAFAAVQTFPGCQGGCDGCGSATGGGSQPRPSLFLPLHLVTPINPLEGSGVRRQHLFLWIMPGEFGDLKLRGERRVVVAAVGPAG